MIEKRSVSLPASAAPFYSTLMQAERALAVNLALIWLRMHVQSELANPIWLAFCSIRSEAQTLGPKHRDGFFFFFFFFPSLCHTNTHYYLFEIF